MSSPVWEVYTEKNEVLCKAKCPHCFRWFSYKTNTSGLVRHLLNVHKITLGAIGESNNNFITPTSSRFDVNSLRMQQAKLVVSCGLPFSVVENYQFRKYMQMLRVDAPLISADTNRRDVMKLETEYREKLSIQFKGKSNLCLLMDGWSSANSNFQLYCLVVSYLDGSGEMKQQLVGVFDVQKSTAIDLHKLASIELAKSNMNLAQFKLMVSDGGSNLKTLSDRVKMQRVYCANHRLHLLVTDVCRVSELDKILTKSKKIAATLAKSTKTKSQLRQLAAELNIKSPIPQNYSITRWNGSIDLLRSVKSQIPALAGIPQFAELLFNNRESLLIEFFIDYFRPLYEASRMFEKSTALSSEIIPTFSTIGKTTKAILNGFLSRDDIEDTITEVTIKTISRRTEKLLDEEEKLLKKSKILKFSSFLDPRFSGKKFMNVQEWEEIENLLVLEFKDELIVPASSEPTPSSAAPVSLIEAMNSCISDSSETDINLTERQMAKREIEDYKQLVKQSRTKTINDNPLVFWKVKKNCLPILHRLASQLLAVPASAASTERVFSASSRIVSNRLRNRLNVQSCSSLLMVNAMLGFERTNSDDSDYGVIEEKDEYEELEESGTVEVKEFRKRSREDSLSLYLDVNEQPVTVQETDTEEVDSVDGMDEDESGFESFGSKQSASRARKLPRLESVPKTQKTRGKSRKN